MKSKLGWFVACGLVGSLALGGLAAAMGDANASMDQIPEAARQALQRLAGVARIDEIEREKEHGTTVYEAEWSAGGVTYEATVTADGTLLETEETVSLEHVPTAVRAAIAKYFGAIDKVVVEKKTIIVYEAEGEIDGREKELLIFPTGRVHEQEHDDDDSHDDHDRDGHRHRGHDHDHDDDHDRDDDD